MNERTVECPRCPGCGRAPGLSLSPRELFCPNVVCDVHHWDGTHTRRWNLEHARQGPNRLKEMGTPT